jgi:signal transduction histidine kinase/ligand-binding sensor domain-containing protein/DNA-binding response OmpR family regulator
MLYLILLLNFGFVVIQAQSKAHFTWLNQEDGLVSQDVMCFQQDNSGFIWIGTKYGLNVFDGRNFNIYQLNNGQEPFNSDISSLEKENNNIWIGTLGDGLFMFNATTLKIINIPLVYKGDSLFTVNTIRYWKNNLWIGTDKGLFRISETLNKEFFDLKTKQQNVTELEIFANHLAVGTKSNGIVLISENEDQTRFDFPTEQVSAMQSYQEEILIIGTRTEGLYFLLKSDTLFSQKKVKDPFGSHPLIINELLVDSKNNIWVGTDGGGLFQLGLENNKLEILNNFIYDRKSKNTIASNAIFSLFEDNKGNLWIGTIWKGLSVLNQKTSKTEFIFSDYFGDEHYPVLSVCKEGHDLWAGTDGLGLNIIEYDHFSVNKYNSNTNPGILGDYVQTIFKDSKGQMWLGTFSSGLIKFDKTYGALATYQNKKENPGTLSYNDVRAILEDKNSNLWIATWGGGLNKFIRNKEVFEHYNYKLEGDKTNRADNITSICFSSDSLGLWVATFGNGLFYFDFQKLNYHHVGTSGFKNLKILNIYLDSKGRLWVGTWGDGLKVWDSHRSEEIIFSTLHQISNSRITSIEEDRFGNIWFSSKNGIFKFLPSSEILIKHGGFDLITSKEFHINASFKDENGDIYFGGIEGIIAITPTPELEIENISQPVLTNFQVVRGNQTSALAEKILKSKSIRLAHNQNYFTIAFSSPHFPLSDVNYSFKMEDFNDDWITLSNNQATFTNIPPGSYVFKVRASNNNFQWSKTTNLNIMIAQPIWKMWYAYVFYSLVFIMLLFLFQKYAREWESLKTNLKIESLTREKENEIHKIKNRFFTNISHEIRTPVTLILGATNKLVENGSISKNNLNELEVMRTSSRHLLNLINELLDFRRIEMDGIKLRVAEGNFIKFVREIYLSFQSQAATNSIDYKFLSRGVELSMWYDRDQMEKVIYNLISNAFKYTPSQGSITIEVDNDDQFGFLKVIDSGEGIDEDKLSEIFKRFYQSENAADLRKSGFGLGLSIAKDIVALHGGEIDAANNDEKGICISVKVPLGNSHFTAEQQLKNFKDSEDIDNYLSSGDPELSNVSLSEYSDSTILIVEDNNQLREYIKRLFPEFHIIHLASNGKEGFEKTLENIPDLIISDVMMPVMDGVTMTKMIKTQVQTSHIPVILLTARTNLIFKKEGFEMGADDYITKPFNETLLRARVYNLLKSRHDFRNKLLNDYITTPQEEFNLNTPDQKFLADLTKVIEQNIHENTLTAKLISSELCMSHSVVYKKIKALTGLSMIEFIRDFKLKRAAVLLVKYQMNVSDVCYKVGFSDRRYFSKLFKAKFGQTPSDYAKSDTH